MLKNCCIQRYHKWALQWNTSTPHTLNLEGTKKKSSTLSVFLSSIRHYVLLTRVKKKSFQNFYELHFRKSSPALIFFFIKLPLLFRLMLFCTTLQAADKICTLTAGLLRAVASDICLLVSKLCIQISALCVNLQFSFDGQQSTCDICKQMISASSCSFKVFFTGQV